MVLLQVRVESRKFMSTFSEFFLNFFGLGCFICYVPLFCFSFCSSIFSRNTRLRTWRTKCLFQQCIVLGQESVFTECTVFLYEEPSINLYCPSIPYFPANFLEIFLRISPIIFPRLQLLTLKLQSNTIFFNLPFKTLNITGCYSIILPFKDDFKLQTLCPI